MRFWLIPFNREYKYISNNEKKIANSLKNKKNYSYRFSRGYLRYCLSKVFDLPSSEIPIISLPGEAPILPKEFGHISMSHCTDALLIGWSPMKIGVDLENVDRKINTKILIKSKWFKNEKKFLENTKKENLAEEILKIWVLKEASIKSHLGSIHRDYDNWQFTENYTNAKNNHLNINRFILNKKIDNWLIGLACEEYIENKSKIIELL